VKKNIFILLLLFALFVISYLITKKDVEKPDFRGFGWYGYLTDDKLNEETIERIKKLGGDSVNINVYYEYDPQNRSFILKSNLTRIEENIALAHQNNLKVFLSPFINLVGGHYLANAIDDDVKEYLYGARNISLELAHFSENNGVELYGIWNELGLSLSQLPNSTNVVNDWLQNTRIEVEKIYDGYITTKEGVQIEVYKEYDFSGFDYIGVTFYPSTESCYTDTFNNMTFCGVESLEEYEEVVKEEYRNLIELKQKFRNKGIVLGEIGIDVVGGNFVGTDDTSKQIRTDAYKILLVSGENKIDGFFFSKFEYDDGGSKDKIKTLMT